MSDADRFAAEDTKHDMCDQFPCRECQAELNQCPGCGDYLYDAKHCDSCDELMAAIVANHKAKENK